MDYIDRYIDRNIISEYADKSNCDGYSLHVVDISNNDLSHLMELMVQKDDVLRDIILDHIQKRIDDRLVEVELDERLERKYA